MSTFLPFKSFAKLHEIDIHNFNINWRRLGFRVCSVALVHSLKHFSS
ncbi:hypothetical protein PALB_8870 [Pseudoalteromonas luteoviolacea B = ATCC 29581]|nr:hypothetical protein PALB_8870 [Pseudoalteromonas luteoviolacea B = ATCC 29581]